MNTLNLKLIAIFTMFLDHLGVLLYRYDIIQLPFYYFLRGVGRIAFPIFAYLIVIGYFYTRDIKKYFIRLLVFAFISEIPYRLFFNVETPNVFFTLLIGYSYIYVREKYNIEYIGLVCIVISAILKSDYTEYGVALIIVFYELYKKNILKKYIFLALFGINVFFVRFDIQMLSVLSGIFIYFTDTNIRVKVSKVLKYSFYIFYPLHLFIFYFIEKFLLKN